LQGIHLLLFFPHRRHLFMSVYMGQKMGRMGMSGTDLTPDFSTILVIQLCFCGKTCCSALLSSFLDLLTFFQSQVLGLNLD
jgi:hypothetical protein